MQVLPTTSASSTSAVDADTGDNHWPHITPAWNPMVVIAAIYAVLFLAFICGAVLFFLRRWRRALARAQEEANPNPNVASTDPEKAETQASSAIDSPESDASGDGGENCADLRSPEMRRTSDESWIRTPPPPMSPLPNRSPMTPMSPTESRSAFPREPSQQVLVWLPSFQSAISHSPSNCHAQGAAARVGSPEPEKEKEPMTPVKEKEEGWELVKEEKEEKEESNPGL